MGNTSKSDPNPANNGNDLLLGLVPRLGEAERKEYFNFHYWRFADTLRECAQWKGGRVLDIGVVPGHMAMALRRLGCEVHGITDHESHGSGRFGNDNLAVRWAEENITLHRAIVDRESLPLQDNFFDGVLFTEILEHLVYDPRPLVQEIFRVLKPGGEVVVSTPNAARIGNRLKALMGHNINPQPHHFYFPNPYMRHNREYTLQEVVDLFSPPFRLLRAKYIRPYDFPVKVSNNGHVYDGAEYADIDAGRPRVPPNVRASKSIASRLLSWSGAVYPPFRSCLLLVFRAEKPISA